MTSERMKLGVLFNFSSKWMGGIIYIINIINTLNFLDDEEKPEIFLFYRPDLKRFIDEMEYPYLNLVEWNFPSITKGTVKSILLRKNLFIADILAKYNLDSVYPLQDYPVRTKTKTKLVSWCADFQHRHYPEFFTTFQRTGRNLRTMMALRNNDYLVLSSNDALNDLRRFFKVPGKLKLDVFHFVSVLKGENEQEIESLKSKYNLPSDYFLVSNQFHKHKNHRVLLLTLARLNELGIRKHFAFTGKLPDESDSPYLKELHSIIEKNNLMSQISMLGIISRADQLAIMKHSQAVIQPSLFEGWSTVIEDAKSLQVPVVASNLKVNIEQLGDKGVYFDPHNVEELVSIIKDYPSRNPDEIFYQPYKARIKAAAAELLGILS